MLKNEQGHSAPDGFELMTHGGAFSDRNGPLYVRKIDATLAFRVAAEHCNPLNMCHGGWLATFLDMQLPMVALMNESFTDSFLLTISLSLDYLAPAARGSWVEGRATLLRSSKNLVFVQGLATCNDVPLVRANGIYKPVARKLQVGIQ